MNLYLTSLQPGALSSAWHEAQPQSDSKSVVTLPHTQGLLLHNLTRNPPV